MILNLNTKIHSRFNTLNRNCRFNNNNNRNINTNVLLSPPQERRTNHNSNSNNDSYSNTIRTINSRRDALQVLNLHKNVTLKEVIMNYRSLARIYHLDKWSSGKNFTKEKGIKMFKLIANARELLLS